MRENEETERVGTLVVCYLERDTYIPWYCIAVYTESTTHIHADLSTHTIQSCDTQFLSRSHALTIIAMIHTMKNPVQQILMHHTVQRSRGGRAPPHLHWHLVMRMPILDLSVCHLSETRNTDGRVT